MAVALLTIGERAKYHLTQSDRFSREGRSVIELGRGLSLFLIVVGVTGMVTGCAGAGAEVVSGGRSAPATAEATVVPTRWIVEASATSDSVPDDGISRDLAPVEQEAGPETVAWAEEVLTVVSASGEWRLLGAFKAVPPDSPSPIRVLNLGSPIAGIAMSQQQLSEPLRLLPPADTPGIERLGSYTTLDDGSELLVVDLQAYSGGTEFDYHVFHVTPGGRLTDLRYALTPTRQGELRDPELTREELVALAISGGRSLR